MPMDDRHDVTVPMESDLVDQIDAELTYGDSRSAWIREAVRQRLNRSGTADACDEPASA